MAAVQLSRYEQASGRAGTGCSMDDKLAKDLVAMWQSELTAMAADRELRETWAATMVLWAQAAYAAAALLPHERNPAGSSRTAEPPRPPAVAAAPQPGLAEIEQLNSRIAELEQRLASFMAGQPGGGAS
jgi:hypothetical protein